MPQDMESLEQPGTFVEQDAETETRADIGDLALDGRLSDDTGAPHPTGELKVDNSEASSNLTPEDITEGDKFKSTLEQHPRDNKNLAWEMAHAEQASRDMIDNLKNSNLPDKEQLVEILDKKASRLAEKAQERYLKAEQAYNEVRDISIGNILYLMDTKSSYIGTEIFMLDNIGPMGGNVPVGEGRKVHLSEEQVGRLRTEIYTMLGGHVPRFAEFTHKKTSTGRYEKAVVATNVHLPKNMELVEKRVYKNEGDGSYLSIGLQHK